MAFSLPVVFLLFAALLTVVYVSAVFHSKGWVVRFLFPGRPVQTVSWDWWDALLIGALFFLLPGIVLFLFEALPVSASGFFTISEEEFQRALFFDGGGRIGNEWGNRRE